MTARNIPRMRENGGATVTDTDVSMTCILLHHHEWDGQALWSIIPETGSIHLEQLVRIVKSSHPSAAPVFPNYSRPPKVESSFLYFFFIYLILFPQLRSEVHEDKDHTFVVYVSLYLCMVLTYIGHSIKCLLSG